MADKYLLIVRSDIRYLASRQVDLVRRQGNNTPGIGGLGLRAASWHLLLEGSMVHLQRLKDICVHIPGKR